MTPRGRRTRSFLAGALAVAALTGCTTGPAAPVDDATSGISPTGGAASARDTSWVRAENAKPGATDWHLGAVATDTELAGYLDHVSVTPGEQLTLRATSMIGDYTVTAYRLGSYGGAGAREVWHADAPVKGITQPTARIAADRTVTTDWSPSATIPTTGWPEGSYLLLLRATNGGKARYVPVVVRSATTRDRLVLDSAVLTYEAYNRWGGYSLYKGPDGSFASRSSRVSFDRPYDRDGAMEVLKFEVPVVQRAEKVAAQKGIDLAYTTAWDLDRTPGVLDGARGLVTMGHDEYWTVSERDAVERARDAGTNLAFLGANTSYWRVRLEDGGTGPGRTIVGYKSAQADPVNGPTTTAMWRQAPHARPENSLVGMLYECFPASGALVVHDPPFFAFAAAGAKAGSTYPGLVGTEVDRAYPVAGTPKTLQVTSHSPVPCATKGRTFSDATYYTVDSGAGVFATGTMMWASALFGEPGPNGLTRASVDFAGAATDALFTEMAAGPLGRSHPAVPNLAGLAASASTATGTGGPVGGTTDHTRDHPDDD